MKVIKDNRGHIWLIVEPYIVKFWLNYLSKNHPELIPFTVSD